MAKYFGDYIDYSYYWNGTEDLKKIPIIKYNYVKHTNDAYTIDPTVKKETKDDLIKKIDLKFLLEALLSMEWSKIIITSLDGLHDQEVFSCPYCEQICWEEDFSRLERLKMERFKHLSNCKINNTIKLLQKICK